MTIYYDDDLAYIHDVGFNDYALKSAPEILLRLKSHQILTGLIVDLGCGSGITAEVLHRAGYGVLGIDISAAMIAIAKARVPTAEFRVDSFFTAPIPACAAVISIGECLNYRFDENSDERLDALFQQIYQALRPGGVFIFDVATLGQVPSGEIIKTFTEGQDWLVLVEKSEDLTAQTLTRRIITLRQVGGLYQRTDEVHRLRLFEVEHLTQALQQVGFQVEVMENYGLFQLPPAHTVFIANSPPIISAFP
jgi:SAM-dependent methyltransferase